MGGETTKIGVGPSGAVAALIQLIAIAVGGRFFFFFLSPAQILGGVMLPASMFMLVWLGILVLIGGGWPLAPPLGRWKPGVNRALPGFGMTAIWWVLLLAIRQYNVLAGISALWGYRFLADPAAGC
jgi:hypothetical protein